MGVHVALVRGINVGRARRIAMGDLRQLLVAMGCERVRTVLNSGNAVFESAQDAPTLARRLQEGIEQRFGFRAAVQVVTAAQLADVVARNPLGAQGAADPSRLIVAFMTAQAQALDAVQALAARPWAPDALALGPQAAYLWCEGGVLASPLMQAFARATGECATTRNWATVQRLAAQLTEQ